MVRMEYARLLRLRSEATSYETADRTRQFRLDVASLEETCSSFPLVSHELFATRMNSFLHVTFTNVSLLLRRMLIGCPFHTRSRAHFTFPYTFSSPFHILGIRSSASSLPPVFSAETRSVSSLLIPCEDPLCECVLARLAGLTGILVKHQMMAELEHLGHRGNMSNGLRLLANCRIKPFH